MTTRCAFGAARFFYGIVAVNETLFGPDVLAGAILCEELPVTGAGDRGIVTEARVVAVTVGDIST